MLLLFEKFKLNYLIVRQKRIKQLRLATYLIEPALKNSLDQALGELPAQATDVNLARRDLSQPPQSN